MNAVFADTSYFLAILNPTDRHHALAVDYNRLRTGRLITTHWVLLELADGLADHRTRHGFLRLLEALAVDPTTMIIPASAQAFDQGLDLYAHRPDKDWSLTDCTSFVAMREHNLTDALTADHHFHQAGFTPLLLT